MYSRGGSDGAYSREGCVAPVAPASLSSSSILAKRNARECRGGASTSTAMVLMIVVVDVLATADGDGDGGDDVTTSNVVGSIAATS